MWSLQQASLEALLSRTIDGDRWEVWRSNVWLYARPVGTPYQEHGWKLHVSARADQLSDVASIVLPALVRARCAFKLAVSADVLRELNDGITAPAAVGKAFTVYPQADQVSSIAQRLVELLDGWQGPRVLSDRRVSGQAPVYYRYGPFHALWQSDPAGRLISVINGPNGQTFDSEATLEYRQPPWVNDPFAMESQSAASPTHEVLLGGRYKVIGGVTKSGRGTVYRAVQLTSGQPVIVKQARPLVAEDHEGLDVRMRLRNERRVLEALAGVEHVPQLIDHFRHGDDEYLVVSDQGEFNLADDVAHNGRYVSSGRRNADSLAKQLARTLCDIHARGVVVRDVTPGNIVVSDDGVSLVDFGIAVVGNVVVRGATPGYAPSWQQQGAPPSVADDAYALGMTLLFAVSGLHPVNSDDSDIVQLRARQTLTSLASRAPMPVLSVIRDLIECDPKNAGEVLRRVRSAEPRQRTYRPVHHAGLPAITDTLIDEVIAHLRGVLCMQVTELMGRDSSASPPGHDSSVYTGAAGIGLELVRHLYEPAVQDVLPELAAFARQRVSDVRLPPGLYVGSTGVEIFLRELIDQGVDVPSLAEEQIFPPEPWSPEGDDLFVGASGIGLGHLILQRYDRDPRHLVAARHLMGSIRFADGVRTPFEDKTPVPPRTGIDVTAGRAHGLAGALTLGLRLAQRLPSDRALVGGLVADLARRARILTARATTPSAAPLSVSWCRGLTGIAHTLIDASDTLGEPSWMRIAAASGEACRARIPYMAMPGQCCGLAGVGTLLVRLAQATQQDRFHAGAREVALQLLIRSGGPDGAPAYVVRSGRNPASWAVGTAGILQFYRCLRSGFYADILPSHAEQDVATAAPSAPDA